MHADADELYKHRLIQFCRFHPDPDQAGSAARWLRGVAGIQTVQVVSPYALAVVYDLRCVALEGVERALAELGYHLDNSLLCKLKRALFYYTEETQRENLAIAQEGELVQRDVFVNRYRRATHGCRDPQPEYWREYQ
ncbi:MAG TPA: hypothetical protein PK880_04265 [Candidatus Competibacter sp.]|nr:hypothetical protein [Candidatus Competibacteraceae bacterium]HRC71729.1 hypothetical protein [Candidatus Competibacter sp.]